MKKLIFHFNTEKIEIKDLDDEAVEEFRMLLDENWIYIKNKWINTRNITFVCIEEE